MEEPAATPPLNAETVNAAASVGAEWATRTDRPVAAVGMAIDTAPRSVITITAVTGLAESGISSRRTRPAASAQPISAATGRRAAERPAPLGPVPQPTPQATE